MSLLKSINKELGKLVMIGCAVIIALIYWLSLDYKCQFYGIKSFVFNNTLGVNLKPKFIDYYPQRFVFLDKNEYEYIAKDFKFDGFEFEIDSIISYGCVNDSFIVVNCLDAKDSLHTLVVRDVMGKIAIEDNPIFEKFGKEFNVSIDNIIGIRSRKNMTLIIFLVIIIVFIKHLKHY